jgi:hypothetical protein
VDRDSGDTAASGSGLGCGKKQPKALSHAVSYLEVKEVAFTLLASALFAAAQAPPRVEPASAGLLAAFEEHRFVAVSEGHRLEQDKQFLLALVASPEFPAKANDVVIEFGNARLQSVLDRYVAGEQVAPDVLRRVWADTTVVNGLWDAPVYERFLAGVRERNRALPKLQRLRVLACDPPIDWAKVKSVADAAPYLDRDSFCASVLEREVMAKRRRVLVVMGDAHVARRDVTGRQVDNAVTLVERRHPGSVFVALSYLGQYKDSALIEERLAASPIPSLSRLRGTWLGALPAVPPRAPIRTRVGGGQAISETVAVTNSALLEDVADALLYLGPKTSLTRSRPSPERFSPDDLQELERLWIPKTPSGLKMQVFAPFVRSSSFPR